MLTVIRAMVCQFFGKVHEISDATGVSVDDLRSFAFGKATLSGFDLDQLADFFNLELVPRRPDLLPGERETAEGIRQDFARDFQYTADTLKFGLRVIGWQSGGPKLPNIQKPRGLTWPVVHLALGIYTKILKQGRAVIALCELGLVKDAGAIDRCMFEAVLALQYLLRPRVPICENGDEITEVKVQTGTPNAKGQYPPKTLQKVKRLTTRMRALLYHAHDCIVAEEELDDFIKLGRKDLLDQLGNPAEIRKLAAKARKAIGPAWAQQQANAGTYSGVKIKHLASSYGLLDHYASIYRRQSKTVHGTDGADFFDVTNGLKLDIGPSPDKIEAVLFLAASLMIGAIETLNGRLGLGFDDEVRQRLRNLKERGHED